MIAPWTANSWFLPLALGAAVLIVAGVMTWALIGDRSRGRRRCGRCWYDMSATPGLTCPECGRTARSESRLFRTRRRWRWAIAVPLLPAVVIGAAVLPRLLDGRWVADAPDIVLIAVLPWRSEPPTGEASRQPLAPGERDTVLTELDNRSLGKPWTAVPNLAQRPRWWRWIAARRCAAALRPDEPVIMVRSVALLRSLGTDASAAGPRLMALADDTDTNTRIAALECLVQLDGLAADALPALERAIGDRRRPDVQYEVCRLYVELASARRAMWSPPGLLLAAEEDPSELIRSRAMTALEAFRATDGYLRLLREALVGSEPEERRSAMRRFFRVVLHEHRAGAVRAGEFIGGASPWPDEAIEVMLETRVWPEEALEGLFRGVATGPMPLARRLEVLRRGIGERVLAEHAAAAAAGLGSEARPLLGDLLRARNEAIPGSDAQGIIERTIVRIRGDGPGDEVDRGGEP